MKLLLHYLKRHKTLVVLALFLTTIDQVFSNMVPYIFGNRLVDPFANKAHYFREHGLRSEFLHGIETGMLMIAGVSIVAWIAKGFQDYTINTITRKFGAELYADIQRHILCLPYQDFEDRRSGEILSLLQKTRQDCEAFLVRFTNVLFAGVIAFSVVAVIAFQLSPLLTAVYLIGAILLSLVTHYLSQKIKSIQKEILEESNALAGSVTESLRNIELVKSLGLIQQEILRFNKINFKILKNELIKVRKINSIGLLYGSFIQLLNQASMLTLLLFIFYDKLTVGQLFMMQTYYFFVFGALQDLNLVIVSYREAQASLNSLQVILSHPIEHRPKNPKPIGPISTLRFENVYFQHQSAVRPALENISFEIKLGETAAIVGPSGSGKTTLVKLLTGLYKPDSGNIYYNGSGQGQIDLDELRHQVGLVTQDAQLFSATIKDNLLFVNPEATDKMIDEALQNASCYNLLTRSSKGTATMIGEGGLKLSGGERQRISIARSLMRQSRLLIFDEATSSLDSLTEKEIADTIRKITGLSDYITIMIAHRLSTIMFADRIYVLEHGRIIEAGNHASLLEKRGLYYAMWCQQTGQAREVSTIPF